MLSVRSARAASAPVESRSTARCRRARAGRAVRRTSIRQCSLRRDPLAQRGRVGEARLAVAGEVGQRADQPRDAAPAVSARAGCGDVVGDGRAVGGELLDQPEVAGVLLQPAERDVDLVPLAGEDPDRTAVVAQVARVEKREEDAQRARGWLGGVRHVAKRSAGRSGLFRGQPASPAAVRAEVFEPAGIDEDERRVRACVPPDPRGRDPGRAVRARSTRLWARRASGRASGGPPRGRRAAGRRRSRRHRRGIAGVARMEHGDRIALREPQRARRRPPLPARRRSSSRARAACGAADAAVREPVEHVHERAALTSVLPADLVEKRRVEPAAFHLARSPLNIRRVPAFGSRAGRQRRSGRARPRTAGRTSAGTGSSRGARRRRRRATDLSRSARPPPRAPRAASRPRGSAAERRPGHGDRPRSAAAGARRDPGAARGHARRAARAGDGVLRGGGADGAGASTRRRVASSLRSCRGSANGGAPSRPGCPSRGAACDAGPSRRRRPRWRASRRSRAEAVPREGRAPGASPVRGRGRAWRAPRRRRRRSVSPPGRGRSAGRRPRRRRASGGSRLSFRRAPAGAARRARPATAATWRKPPFSARR